MFFHPLSKASHFVVSAGIPCSFHLGLCSFALFHMNLMKRQVSANLASVNIHTASMDWILNEAVLMRMEDGFIFPAYFVLPSPAFK